LDRPDVPPDVVAAAQAGDDRAFEAIVRHYQQTVFGLAWRLTGNAAQAEELAQEAFLRAWRKLGSFDTARPLRPWLLRLARNACLNALRKWHPPTVSIHAADEEDHVPELAAEGPTVPDAAADRELAARAEAAIAQLPQEYRVVVTLRHLEGLAYEDIAKSLRLPLGTVKVRLHRARERLRRMLGEQDE
jgi:RNA polymerase sigma-70 factor (ECF subfamily)